MAPTSMQQFLVY